MFVGSSLIYVKNKNKKNLNYDITMKHDRAAGDVYLNWYYYVEFTGKIISNLT